MIEDLVIKKILEPTAYLNYNLWILQFLEIFKPKNRILPI
jgi:hypothetical protein